MVPNWGEGNGVGGRWGVTNRNEYEVRNSRFLNYKLLKFRIPLKIIYYLPHDVQEPENDLWNVQKYSQGAKWLFLITVLTDFRL